MLAGYQRHRDLWFMGLFNYFQLLFWGLAPTVRNTGAPFHPVGLN
jgi:hypothetical protein